jgi:hypothetical protein
MRLQGKGVVLLVLAVLAVGAAVAAEPDWYCLHPDSLFAPGRQAEPFRLPTNKLFYLEQKYGLCPSQRHTDDPESLNVRMVGKWGGGPSWGVTGRDTLVYLSRGSEVVVINFADTASPEILNHIQAKRLAGRPVLQEDLLYLATSGYIEVFDVSDPTNAPRVGRLSVPVADIDVEDSLVYVVGADSFMVWNFADPGNPWLVGACRDSGYALDVDRGYAYLRDRWGMYILDVTDPAAPRRVAAWGTDIAGVKVRGNHCYVAQGQMGSNSLHVLNVADPANPWEEGRLSGLTAEDIHLLDTLLFMPGFYVVSIADPSRPRLLGQAPAGGYEVWVDDAVRYGVTANWAHGLRVLNLADLANPVLDTTMLAAYAAADISVKDGIACVASQRDYMMLFDISNPAEPREVGRYFAPGGGMESVLNAGSLAYVPAYAHTHDTVLHAVDITDPSHPVMVGAVGGWEGPYGMVLQDSFLYCAEPYRFEVFSVANPRQPVWRGRCNSIDMVLCGLDVAGDHAYEIAGPYGLAVINIEDPGNPYVVSTTTGHPTYSAGVAVRDTFAYVPSAYDTLWVHSMADPARPRVVGCAPIDDGGGYDICLRDSYAFLGGVDFHVFDISSPAQPVRAGYHESPYRAFDVTCDSSYIYVASYLAGVAVYEVLPVGLAEPGRADPLPGHLFSVVPNPARATAAVRLAESQRPAKVTIRDVAGRAVSTWSAAALGGTGTLRLDLSGLKAGVYFVEVGFGGVTQSRKLVKQ